MKPLLFVVPILLMILAPGVALGDQHEGTVTPPQDESVPDFRGKVTLAYGLVVAAVVVYLLISHRRDAGLRSEMEFLERRVEQLTRKDT